MRVMLWIHAIRIQCHLDLGETLSLQYFGQFNVVLGSGPVLYRRGKCLSLA